MSATVVFAYPLVRHSITAASINACFVWCERAC